MTLRLIQKPPVVFTPYDPAAVLEPSAFAEAARTGNPLPLLWAEYGRAVLSDVDPCMESNDGAWPTVSFARRQPGMGGLDAWCLPGGSLELVSEGASLYLRETQDGDVTLMFLPPDDPRCGGEEFRIDLSDYGSDAAGYFIATLFAGRGRIARLLDGTKPEGR